MAMGLGSLVAVEEVFQAVAVALVGSTPATTIRHFQLCMRMHPAELALVDLVALGGGQGKMVAERVLLHTRKAAIVWPNMQRVTLAIQVILIHIQIILGHVGLAAHITHMFLAIHIVIHIWRGISTSKLPPLGPMAAEAAAALAVVTVTLVMRMPRWAAAAAAAAVWASGVTAA